jgi:hypothetical protein
MKPRIVHSMRNIERRGSALLGAVLLIASAAAGCSTLRGVDALRQVDFALDRVTDVRLGGLVVRDVRSVDDLDTAQGASRGGGLDGTCRWTSRPAGDEPAVNVPPRS